MQIGRMRVRALVATPDRQFYALLGVAALLSIALLVAPTAVLIERLFVEETQRITADAVAMHFRSVLGKDVFRTPLSRSDLAALDRIVRAHFDLYDIVDVWFFRPDGSVAYRYDESQDLHAEEADNYGYGASTGSGYDESPARAGHNAVGQEPHLAPGGAATLDGAMGATVALALAGTATLDRQTSANGADLLRLVLPVSDGTSIVGVAVVYRDISRLLVEIRTIQVFVSAAVVLAMTAVFFLLRHVYVRSARRIRSEEAERRTALAQVEALSQLGELKDEFVSTVSHDLRSPLVPLLTYSELLAQEMVEPADVPVLGAEMQLAASRMQRLVEDLLEINRLEEGRLRLELGAVDLAATVALATRDLVGSEQTHPIVIDLEPALPAVWADQGRLMQVLTNLLNNAVRYSPAGGQITIRAQRTDGRVWVSVSDRGIGIPADKLPRIFERFYRVENEATRGIPGTGLGLAICKRLIEAQGGQIRVESEERRGTTFTFTLPLASAGVEAPPERLARAA